MKYSMIKIAFFGTPEFAWNILSWILEYSEIDTALVVSQPDKPVWRKKELFPTPVKQFALDAWIEVMQPNSLNSLLQGEIGLQENLKKHDLDFIVVVAYGKIIPKEILDIPKYGCINLHGSILPQYRWASPVQASVKAGDRETGLTTMYMSEWMDEGDILQIQKVSIDPDDSSLDIFQKFTDIWPSLLVDTLKKVQSWELEWAPQNNGEATYCGKISREDGEVRFQKQSAQEIYNTYRAYTPWPGIYTWYEGKRLVLEEVRPFIWELEYEAELQSGKFTKLAKNHYGIVCSDWEILEILRVKLEGKKSMDAMSFVNGNREVLEYCFQ